VGQNSLMVARAVAYKSLRPEIPAHCPEIFEVLMKECWADNANTRPSFRQILTVLDDIDSSANEWLPIPDKDGASK
jgi:hypothetical protein